jgi:sigma-B regulation protein RsbU (phosphoserine phosphatase)
MDSQAEAAMPAVPAQASDAMQCLPDIRAYIRRAFNDVSEAEIEALCQVAELRRYPPDHTLCHEGELEHVFYILGDGQVAITHRLADDEERLISLLHPGQFFGEMALIEQKPRTASVRTTADTTVLEISEEVFNQFLRDSPAMALSMIRHITANLRSSDQAAIIDLSQKNRELAKAYDELKEAQADLVAKERMERELEIAGEVQRNLLPSEFPATPGYSFAGQNVPARHVGGDLYDVIKIDAEHVGLLMADVSDKSVHAALIMAVTRTLFLAHARSSLSPADVALAVHAGLLEVSASDDMFVTAFYGVLHLPSGALQYVRAGQDKPLLFRADGSPPEPLEAEGRFLGMLENLVLEQRWVTLRPGDMLLTFSDGVPDAVNSKNEAYGGARLIALIHGRRFNSADEVCQVILEDVYAFRGQAEAFDDITMLVTRCESRPA